MMNWTPSMCHMLVRDGCQLHPVHQLQPVVPLSYHSTGGANLAELRPEDAKTNVWTIAQRPCLQYGYPETMSHVGCLLVVRKKIMGCFGYVYKREDPLSRIGQVVSLGRRPRGRPKKRWQDCIRGCLVSAGAREDAAGDRSEWRGINGRLTSS